MGKQDIKPVEEYLSALHMYLTAGAFVNTF